MRFFYIFVLRKRTLRAVLWKPPPPRLRQGREKMRPPPRRPPSSLLARSSIIPFPLFVPESEYEYRASSISVAHTPAPKPCSRQRVTLCMDATLYNARVGISKALTSHPRGGEGGAQAVRPANCRLACGHAQLLGKTDGLELEKAEGARAGRPGNDPLLPPSLQSLVKVFAKHKQEPGRTSQKC